MAEKNIDRKNLIARAGFIFIIIAALAILLFILTYLGINQSRKDSLELLRQQGTALIESLVLSSDNILKANSFFDLLVREKFSDMVSFLQARDKLDYTSPELADFTQGYNVLAIMIFDNELQLKASGSRGVFFDINRIYPIVIPEIENLNNDNELTNTYDIIEGTFPEEQLIYYLEKVNNGKEIIAIVADAGFYVRIKENIGIGYMVQNIAREIGISYILFQTPEGIVFSSKKIGPLLKIEKDSLLAEAMVSDSVFAREHKFIDRPNLELIKRFSSEEYGVGLFRLGISLDKYYSIVGAYDRQMIVLSIVIFAVLVLLILYLSGKQKRVFLNRSFQRIKSLSEKVFDSINAGIVVINRNRNIDLANNQFYQIMEIKERTIEGARWDEYDFFDIIEFEKVLNGETETGDKETSILFPSGQKQLLINTGRLFDHNDQISAMVVLVYDFTLIRELEETARRKERLTEMGDLAAGVAHEIRNPLNAISIAAQRLLGEFEVRDNQDEYQQFLGQIRSEAKRLNEIVNRFLSMTREKGRGTEMVDLSEIISETVELQKIGNQNRRISISEYIEPGIKLPISGDRMRQLLINLLKNSLQALETDGGEIEVDFQIVNNHPILAIRDNGPGIPNDLISRIFSPYFTTKAEGTGLGLSIVHQIIEEFNARIEVTNRKTGGAQFIITFPN